MCLLYWCKYVSIEIHLPKKKYQNHTMETASHILNLEQYDYDSKLGNGGFGTVSKWIRKSTRKSTAHDPSSVAIKTFKKLKYALLEYAILKKLGNHMHIVRSWRLILDYTDIDDIKMYLPLECMDDTLKSLLRLYPKGVSFCEAHRIYLMLASGLKYIHENGFMHRDIKPENILCTSCGNPAHCNIKFTDFGISARYIPGRNNSLNVQTMWYTAPEVLLGDSHYTPSIDFWSVGLIYVQLLGTGRRYIEIEDYHTDKNQFMQWLYLIGYNSQSWPEIRHLPKYKVYGLDKENDQQGIIFKTLTNAISSNVIAQKVVHSSLSLNPKNRQLITDFSEYTTENTCSRRTIQKLSRTDREKWADDAFEAGWERTRGDFRQDNELTSIRGFNQEEPLVNASKAWHREDINIKMRVILLSWLLEVNESTFVDIYNKSYIFHATVEILDRFMMSTLLSKKTCGGRKNLQCLGAASFLLATYIHDRNENLEKDMVRASDGLFTKEDLKKNICMIVDELQFDVFNMLIFDCFNDMVPPIIHWTSTLIVMFRYDEEDRLHEANATVRLASRLCQNDMSKMPDIHSLKLHQTYKPVSESIHDSLKTLWNNLYKKHKEHTCENLQTMAVRKSVWKGESKLQYLMMHTGKAASTSKVEPVIS